MEKAGRCVDELAAVCEEFNIKSPKETFGFTFDKEANRYRLFIDYEVVLSCCK